MEQRVSRYLEAGGIKHAPAQQGIEGNLVEGLPLEGRGLCRHRRL